MLINRCMQQIITCKLFHRLREIIFLMVFLCLSRLQWQKQTKERWPKDLRRGGNFHIVLGHLMGSISPFSPKGTVGALSGTTIPGFQSYWWQLLIRSTDFCTLLLALREECLMGASLPTLISKRQMDKKVLNVPPAEPLPGTDIDMPYMFIADEAYPLRTEVMKQYPSCSWPAHLQLQVVTSKMCDWKFLWNTG